MLLILCIFSFYWWLNFSCECRFYTLLLTSFIWLNEYNPSFLNVSLIFNNTFKNRWKLDDKLSGRAWTRDTWKMNLGELLSTSQFVEKLNREISQCHEEKKSHIFFRIKWVPEDRTLKQQIFLNKVGRNYLEEISKGLLEIWLAIEINSKLKSKFEF